MNLIHYNILKFNNFPSGILFLAIAGLFLISGCAIDFSKYGEYQRRWEVTVMFGNGNLPPDYTYYYANTSSHPKALIGIEPAYMLDNHLWTQVTSDQLKQLMDNMWIREDYWAPFYGSHIVDPNGKIIGIYYSRWNGGPIMMGSDNKVNIHLPFKQDEKPRLFFRGMDD